MIPVRDRIVCSPNISTSFYNWNRRPADDQANARNEDDAKKILTRKILTRVSFSTEITLVEIQIYARSRNFASILFGENLASELIYLKPRSYQCLTILLTSSEHKITDILPVNDDIICFMAATWKSNYILFIDKRRDIYDGAGMANILQLFRIIR